MARPGITDPDVRNWLFNDLLERLNEYCQRNLHELPDQELEKIINTSIDEHVEEWSDIWFSSNYAEYIESFGSDEEALKEHADLVSTGNLYVNYKDEIFDSIVSIIETE